MVYIVGVHGIGQSGIPRTVLVRKWSTALTGGLGRFGHDHGCEPLLEVPHWASLLSQGAHRLGPEADLFDDLVPLQEGEAAFLIEACTDILGPERTAHALEARGQTLGPPRMWPTDLNLLVSEIDLRHPGIGRRVVRVLREVRYYLYESVLASRVRQLVAQACTARTNIVLGHSLGGVIAYDLLMRKELPSAEGGAARTLITCGSPLALPTVRRGLGCPDGELLPTPENVRWVNVYDPGDIVTGGMGLGLGTDVIEDTVDNGRWDPHGIGRYLGSEPVARAVLGGRW